MAVYIIHTPKLHYNSIFNPSNKIKIWGIPDNTYNRNIWKDLVKNDKFLFVCKVGNNYQIVGLGVLDKTFESTERVKEWEPESHKFSLRMIFSEIKDFRENPKVVNLELPLRFSIKKVDYNEEIYFNNRLSIDEGQKIERNNINFLRLILKFADTVLTNKITMDFAKWIPIRFLEPLLLDEYDWREFEKITWDIFRALGFNLEELGHKYEGKDLPDFKINSDETPSAIGDSKCSYYSPDKSEERKIVDYWRGEKKGTPFIIVAKSFDHSRMVNIAKEGEKESLGTLICITYENLILILMMKIQGSLQRTKEVWDKLIELKETIL